MLYVKVRQIHDGDTSIDEMFRYNSDPEWFNDDFVNKIITEIDHNEILAPGVYKSPVLGIIGPDRLSGSCKGLIMAYKLPGFSLNNSIFDDECTPWLIKISQSVDVRLICSTCIVNYPDRFDAVFADTNEITHTADEFSAAIAKRLAHMIANRKSYRFGEEFPDDW